jgi:multiple sugar transport system permease protein
MSAVPTVTPDAGAAVTATEARTRSSRPRSGRPGVFPTLFMLAFLVYFLMPLTWLFIASTKSLDNLFSSFGLWFSGFNLVDNIRDTFAKDGGVYLTWLRNTLMYSFVSAVGAALLAATAGYGFAKFDFKGKNLLFWFVLGSVMVPTTALAIPTYLMFSKLGFTNNPLSVILPSLVSPFGIYLMRIYAEAAVPSDLIEAARIDGAG